MEELTRTLQYFWNHLNDTVKGIRSKTSPASLTGGPKEGF
jgi:hypothetical protein